MMSSDISDNPPQSPLAAEEPLVMSIVSLHLARVVASVCTRHARARFLLGKGGKNMKKKWKIDEEKRGLRIYESFF